MSAPTVFPPPIDPIDIDPGVAYQYVIPSQGETSLGFYGNTSFDLSLNGRVLTLRFTDTLPAQTTTYTVTVYASNSDGITKQDVTFRIKIPQAWIANPRFRCTPIIPSSYPLGTTLVIPFNFIGDISQFLRNGDKIVFGIIPGSDPISGKTFYVRNIGGNGAGTFNISATPTGSYFSVGPLFGGTFPISGSASNAAVVPIASPSSSTGGGTNATGELVSPSYGGNSVANPGFVSGATQQFSFLTPTAKHRIGIASGQVGISGPFDVFDSGAPTAPSSSILAIGLPTDGRILYIYLFTTYPQTPNTANESTYVFRAASSSSGSQPGTMWVGSASDVVLSDPVGIAFSDGRTIPSDLSGTKYIQAIVDQTHVALSSTPGGPAIVPAEDMQVDPDGSDLFVLYRLKRRFAAITSDAETQVNPSDPISYQATSDIAVDSWEVENLPTGLSLNAQTGAISGSITQNALFAIVIAAVKAGNVSFRYWVLTVGTPTVVTPPGGGGTPGISPSLLQPIVDLIFDLATRRVYDVDGARADVIEVVLGDTPLLIGFRRFNVDDALPSNAQLRLIVKPKDDFDADYLVSGSVTVSGDVPIANCGENWAAQSLFDLFSQNPDARYIDLLGQLAYREKGDLSDRWRNTRPILIRLWNNVFATALPGGGGGGGVSGFSSLDNAGVIPVRLPNNGVFALANIPLAHPYFDNNYALPAQLYSSDIDVRYVIETVKFKDHFDLTITCKDAIAPNAGATRYVDASFDWYTHEYAPVDTGAYSPASPGIGSVSAGDIIVLPGITLRAFVDVSETMPAYPTAPVSPRVASNSGALPPGISLGSDGSLSGVPSLVGSYPILILSGAGGSVVATYSLTITVSTTGGQTSQSDSGGNVPLVDVPDLSFVQNRSLGSGVPVDFSAEPPPSSATIQLAFGSTLPPGLTLDSTGILHGTPTMPGDTTVFINAVIIGATVIVYQLTIHVTAEPPPSYVGNPSLSFKVNQPGNASLDLQDATDVTLTSGSLPTGISLVGFTLSGTPTVIGVYACTFTATGPGGSTDFSVNIIVSA